VKKVKFYNPIEVAESIGEDHKNDQLTAALKVYLSVLAIEGYKIVKEVESDSKETTSGNN